MSLLNTDLVKKIIKIIFKNKMIKKQRHRWLGNEDRCHIVCKSI